MIKVFADTDVCLDLLSHRKPFYTSAAKIFSLADLKKIKICVSSLCFANIDYILKSDYSGKETRQILLKFKTLVTVLPVENKIIDLALASDFNDFEDAIQYHTAIEGGLTTLMTRNLNDYKKALIKVISPDTFLKSID